MYLAELHGKLSSRIERMEDILTSNVFSFFKYSSRGIFLKGYLNELGFDFNDQEANEAEFQFWPKYEENTEPDLVILVGDYYLLFEAKYFSDFGGETEKTKAQLLREIDGGLLDAKNYEKKFMLIAITNDYYEKKDKFRVIPEIWQKYFTWTNWQSVASFLNRTLQFNQRIEKRDRFFATDLYDLLVKKNLRGFYSFDMLQEPALWLEDHSSIFFDAETAKFRGDFIGFTDALSTFNEIKSPPHHIFLEG